MSFKNDDQDQTPEKRDSIWGCADVLCYENRGEGGICRPPKYRVDRMSVVVEEEFKQEPSAQREGEEGAILRIELVDVLKPGLEGPFFLECGMNMRCSYLKLCVVGHHSLETDTDTFNDGKENGAHDGGVTGSLDTTTNSKRATSEETCDNGVPRILLLAHTLNGTVVG